jgi:putative ABC transport system permease protein
MPFESCLGDLRFAWRSARRRPAFTLLLVVTLALGIGVNSAVFTLLDAVLLRPLPYRDPSRLVFVWQTLPEHNILELEPTAFDYDAWRGVRSFSAVGLVANGAFTLTGDEHPERIRGARVTASVMRLLGMTPQIGRAFTEAEDSDSATAVAILSDGLWRRRYGADPAILGRVISVNDAPRAVVGVMPRRASLPGPLAGDDDVWLSASMNAAERANETSHTYTILARLGDTATIASARAEMTAVAARLSAEHPDTHRAIGAHVVPFDEQTVRAIRPTLLVVAAGVALLLLVAAANATTLLLARAANRQHEIAVRAALGATDGRLLSLAVSESFIFALLGGATGLVLGQWTLHGLLPLVGGSLPLTASTASIALDGRTALFTCGLSTVLGVVFGAVVAAHKPGRLSEALKSSARTTTPAGPVARTRSLLVVAQVTLAVVLLSAAGLMVTSVAKLSRVSPGFDAGNVLTFRIAMTGSTYAAAPSRTALISSLIERLSASPEVRSAAVTSMIPFGGSRGANGVEIEGRPHAAGEPRIIIDQRHVSPSYFQTMRIPVLAGRGFLASDDSRAERVTIINRTMADRYWPGQSPLDHRVRLGGGFDSDIWFRIVGVVDDVRHISLSRGPVAEMYHPYAQTAIPTLSIVIRTAGNPAAAAPLARAVMLDLDRNLPLYDVRTMEERIASSFAQTRGTMLLLLVTAGLAAALAAVAIYGSIWYSVTQRIPEIGIRLALGASRASVCGAVVGRALLLTTIGAAAGAAASMAAGPLIRGLLFDTRTTDPLTYGLVMLVVLALTVLASIAPAKRAMSVDPMSALRNW